MNKTTTTIGIIMLLMMSSVTAYGGGGAGIILPLPGQDGATMFRHTVNNVSTYNFECSTFTKGYIVGNSINIYYLCPENYALQSLHLTYKPMSEEDTIEVYNFAMPNKKYRGKEIISAYMIKSDARLMSMTLNTPEGSRVYTGTSLKNMRRTHNELLEKYVVVTEGVNR